MSNADFVERSTNELARQVVISFARQLGGRVIVFNKREIKSFCH